MSPRSGRMKIAQHFSAGLRLTKELRARETGDRVWVIYQSSASRTLFENSGSLPSDKSLGYFRSSALRTRSCFSFRTLLLHSINDCARRNAFDEWQTHHPPARGFNFFASVNLIEGIVAALDQHVGQ